MTTRRELLVSAALNGRLADEELIDDRDR